ncbi:catalase family protein [Roseomonas xinghualingensis]|uniref:catalase family protein n=1 Tax=Roseomonas xinghualingensis TaxID=2986475 RepID=UPI0021F2283D|nr:catalase family protein [Roseomonas sp. SXEYE001]MCV4206677.1 catalase family protein [Roseomonas sp. SXEYE001]
MSVRPIPYDTAFEQLEPGEAETAQDMAEMLRGIAETTFRDYGYPVRSLHAKSHGLLRGELRVTGGFAPAYAQGLFARPGRYPVVLRFSTNPGDLLDDSISVPRGLALKVVGVEGERLPGSEGQATQDFVLVNSPAFAVPKAKDFLTPLKLLAKTTDIPQGYKKVASTMLRGAEAALEAVGGGSPTLKTLGGHPNTHILGETFYSATPFLHGPYMAKYSVAPATTMLKALTGRKVDVARRPDALREEVMAFFASQQGEWDLRVQLCTDIERMPVEDASVEWPEEMSPYVSVGRIIVPPQPSWDEERSKAVDLGMSFSPWHGLAAHRPLGSINRVRKPAYMMSSRFRAEHSGCPMREPGRGEEVPI